MYLKWNAECDESETDYSGNWNKMKGIWTSVGYGMENWDGNRMEYNGKMEWKNGDKYLMAYGIKENTMLYEKRNEMYAV